ncbi:ATP-grasp domain-containing protein [Psychromonas sp. Urea-02u-13]|uniref:ATP-grasp domain-containing protein n=1 Tax=Psychromonas sp. Urea-02u-13 TaxID=2058326 RepID=UPI000C33A3C4|nr:ATP-grasp domain-containing protein [Psychromonas sp. Urea-02u-13]PKG37197.1 mangotoxin biosynthesis protein MboC [Psychromonas sp. Urea-02u-13]
MKSIVIIDPVSSGTAYIAAAKRLGLNVIVISADTGDRKLTGIIRKQVDQIIQADTADYKTLLKLLKGIDNLGAVLSGFEYNVTLCSKLNSELGLNGLDESVTLATRNKKEFRSMMTNHGFKIPQYFTVNASIAEDLSIPNDFQFPAVVKPVDMSGSIGISKVENLQELMVAIKNLSLTPLFDEGFHTNGDIIIEEYISGDEFSVEGVVDNGEVHIISITEKFLGPEPFFVELGHIVGSELNNQLNRCVSDYTQKLVKALKINVGPFHLELRVSGDNQPIAIEIATRLPGDYIVDLIKISKGYDMAEMAINASLGVPLCIKDKDKDIISAIAFIPNNGEKEFNGVCGLDKLVAMSSVTSSLLYLNKGDKLSDKMDFSSRVGHLMLGGDCYQNIKQTIQLINNEAYNL